MNKKFLNVFFLNILIIVISLFCNKGLSVYANETRENISGDLYELNQSNKVHTDAPSHPDAYDYYDYGWLPKTKNYSPIGNFYIHGSISKKSSEEEMDLYSVNDIIMFGYDYDGSYLEEMNQLELYEDGTDEIKIHGMGSDIYELDDDVDYGLMLVLKSHDGSNWVLESEKIQNNFLEDNKNGNSNFYSTLEEDLVKGTYYRVILLYEFDDDRAGRSYTKIAEEYNFFLCYSKNVVSIQDMEDMHDLKNGESVNYGFIINKNGSSCKVEITAGWNSTCPEPFGVNGDYYSHYFKGEYKITITNKVGESYNYIISIKEGLRVQSLSSKIYESEDNAGYSISNRVTRPVYNNETDTPGLTDLRIMYGSNSRLSMGNSNGIYPSYGVDSNFVSFFLTLKYGEQLNGKSWRLSYDNWGSKENEKINNLFMTGTVGSGAVIIQKSKDGKNWDSSMGEGYLGYKYTTDLERCYGSNNNIFLGQVNVEEIRNGIFYRIYYAYEVYQEATNTYKNYVEKYELYLCNNNLEYIKIINLTEPDDTTIVKNAQDGKTLEKLKLYGDLTKTLTDGAQTFTGFSIDAFYNPTIKINVKHNGKDIKEQSKYTDHGKYEILLTSKCGDTKTITIYVDKNPDYSISAVYFGPNLLDGTRIWDDGTIPVYKGDVSYCINSVPDYISPISGKIIRKDGLTYEIAPTHNEKKETLKPGRYTAIFNSNNTINSDKPSGDNWKFTFEFEVKEETYDSRPKTNEGRLKSYSNLSAQDGYPICYGLTYESGSDSGKTITLVYATWDNAYKACIEYERETVSYENGKIWYAINKNATKKAYANQEEVEEAIKEYAKSAVEQICLDFSVDRYKYTLSSELLKEYYENPNLDLKTIKLDHDVFIYANYDERAELYRKLEEISEGKLYPLINDKTYYEMQKDENTEIYSSFKRSDFEFLKNEYDSSSVKVYDCNGKEYKMSYEVSVAEQLYEAEAPTGKIKIVETNGTTSTSTEYYAMYIRQGDISAEFDLTYYNRTLRENQTLHISRKNDNLVINSDSFRIDNFIDTSDPGVHVTVSYNDKDEFYTLDMISGHVWDEKGEYTIRITNRLGYYYTIVVQVFESEKVIISFKGEGTDNIADIQAHYLDKNIILPTIYNLKGYEFCGYKDIDSGEIYTDRINEILTKGYIILSPIWEAKNVDVLMYMPSETRCISYKYGEKVSLPLPREYENYKFVGWVSDLGENIGNSLTIDEENKIRLMAVYEKINKSNAVPEPVPTPTPQQEEKKGDVLEILLIISGLICFVGLSSFLIYKYIYVPKRNKEN